MNIRMNDGFNVPPRQAETGAEKPDHAPGNSAGYQHPGAVAPANIGNREDDGLQGQTQDSVESPAAQVSPDHTGVSERSEPPGGIDMLTSQSPTMASPQCVRPAACACNAGPARPVFALGQIYFDVGNESRRDWLIRAMLADELPGNFMDIQNLLKFLRGEKHKEKEKDKYKYKAKEKANMYEYRMEHIIWTINRDLVPLYAIEPSGPYANLTYRMLCDVLEQQVSTSQDEASWMSVPGILTGKTVRLLSHQEVPVIAPDPRGTFMWSLEDQVKRYLKYVKDHSDLGNQKDGDGDGQDEVKRQLKGLFHAIL